MPWRLLMRLIFLAQFSSVVASSGDRLPQFQDCVAECISSSCPRNLDLVLRLTLWTCEKDCDYRCQQALTHVHETSLENIHQYHGKWPFVRFLGVQEPASVLFSLLNLLPNYLGFRALQKTKNGSRWHMKNYYLFFALVGVNAWVWSSVFHTRDFVLTERLDYFSAMGSILYGLALATIRLLRLDLPERTNTRILVLAALALFYLFHVYYLSFVKFDYGYNMIAGVTAGLLQNALWVTLGWKLYRRTSKLMDLLPVLLVVSLFAGMSFELFDFPPIGRVLDAHALWHAATVLPTHFWYTFLLYDMKKQDRLPLNGKRS